MGKPHLAESLVGFRRRDFALDQMRPAMRRRKFIKVVAASAAAWPLAAHSQQSKVARIGVLYIETADAESLKRELQEGRRAVVGGAAVGAAAAGAYGAGCVQVVDAYGQIVTQCQ
jgi:hypothetical protein